MVCGRGRGCSSGHLSLRFAFYRLDRGHRSGQESPQTPPKVLPHHEHATSRPRNSQIPNKKNSHDKNPKRRFTQIQIFLFACLVACSSANQMQIKLLEKKNRKHEVKKKILDKRCALMLTVVFASALPRASRVGSGRFSPFEKILVRINSVRFGIVALTFLRFG